MISDKIKEKNEKKNSPKKIKLNKINILQKTLSDLNIKIKNNRNFNFLSRNCFSTSRNNRKKNKNLTFLSNILQRNTRSFNKGTLSIKNIFRKNINKKSFMDKIAKEMENKFYMRYREGKNDFDKSFNLYDKMIKTHGKIVKKIFLDYKNIQNYNKEEISSNISNYKRNLEFFENQNLIKEFIAMQNSKKFEKLKSAGNKKSLFPSVPNNNNSKSNESPSSFFSSKKNTKTKSSPRTKRSSVYKNKLEEKVQEALHQNKYLTYRQLKINSKKFCEQVENLDKDCELYEPINDFTSKINIQKNNFFNVGNLDRIIKLECLKDEEYVNDDYERNIALLKKCSKNYCFYCDKAISGYCPSYVKKGSFLPRTIKKYANLQGKFFGLPV